MQWEIRGVRSICVDTKRLPTARALGRFFDNETGSKLSLGPKELSLSQGAAQYYQQRFALSSIVPLSLKIKLLYENSPFGHFISHCLSTQCSDIYSVAQQKIGYLARLPFRTSSSKPSGLNLHTFEEVSSSHDCLRLPSGTATICADSIYDSRTVRVHQTVQKWTIQKPTYRRLVSELSRKFAELALQDEKADELCSPLREAKVSFASPQDTSEVKVMSRRTHRGETEQPCEDQKRSQNHDSAGRRSSKTASTYIALGSNMGNRIEHIEAACSKLNMAGIPVLRASALYETKAMYVEDQDPFINGVCEVTDELFTYTALLAMLN